LKISGRGGRGKFSKLSKRGERGKKKKVKTNHAVRVKIRKGGEIQGKKMVGLEKAESRGSKKAHQGWTK